MIAAMLLIGSSIATSFATQYWHVIISYAIIEGRGAAQQIITGSWLQRRQLNSQNLLQLCCTLTFIVT